MSLISNTAQNVLWHKRIVPTRAPTQAPSSPTIVSTSSARSSRLCETLGDIDCATATSDQKVVVGKLDSAVLSGIFASRDIAFVRPILWLPSPYYDLYTCHKVQRPAARDDVLAKERAIARWKAVLKSFQKRH